MIIDGLVAPQIQTARSLCVGGSIFAVQRLPTDPLFFSTITLQNIAIGTRYLVEYEATPGDWAQLAIGTANASPMILTSIPAYSNPMLLRVRARLYPACGAPRYAPYETFGFLVRGGVLVYVAQAYDGEADC